MRQDTKGTTGLVGKMAGALSQVRGKETQSS